jgi:hypothetical protein
MVISVFNMLHLIHLYKLETAPGPDAAQAQIKMIYELTRPIYARMIELGQQEVESDIDHGRMQMLYSEYEACCGKPSHHEYLRLYTNLLFSQGRLCPIYCYAVGTF